MTGSGAGTAAVFALLGPPLAGLMVSVSILWAQILAMPEVALLTLWAIPLGYLLGVVPALLTGLAAVWLSPRIANGWVWSLASALTGAVFSGVAGPVVGFGGDAFSPLEQVRLFASAGAASSLLCAAICLKFRPRAA